MSGVHPLQSLDIVLEKRWCASQSDANRSGARVPWELGKEQGKIEIEAATAHRNREMPKRFIEMQMFSLGAESGNCFASAGNLGALPLGSREPKGRLSRWRTGPLVNPGEIDGEMPFQHQGRRGVT